MSLTMPSQSQFYASGQREFILQIWDAHTVAAKSLQTLPDVGIRQVGPQQGFLLGPSLSVRSKGDAPVSPTLCQHAFA